MVVSVWVLGVTVNVNGVNEWLARYLGVCAIVFLCMLSVWPG